MSEQIKPCPFCGSEDTFVANNDVSVWVECDDCLAHGTHAMSRELAIAAWNAAPRLTPAERAVLDAAVELGARLIQSHGPGWCEPEQSALERAAKALARERRGG